MAPSNGAKRRDRCASEGRNATGGGEAVAFFARRAADDSQTKRAAEASGTKAAIAADAGSLAAAFNQRKLGKLCNEAFRKSKAFGIGR